MESSVSTKEESFASTSISTLKQKSQTTLLLEDSQPTAAAHVEAEAESVTKQTGMFDQATGQAKIDTATMLLKATTEAGPAFLTEGSEQEEEKNKEVTGSTGTTKLLIVEEQNESSAEILGAAESVIQVNELLKNFKQIINMCFIF